MRILKSTLKENAKNKYYVYFIRIGEPADRLFKIGTTNDLKRRMGEHKRTYKKDVEILGTITLTSEWTPLKVEKKMIEKWKTETDWKYLRNDRFIIPDEVDEVTITVKKDYKIKLR